MLTKQNAQSSFLLSFGIIILSVILCLFISSHSVYSHPGRTDSSGGHTCRTNCESWGLEYGEYHYHNGGGSTGIDHTQEFIDASSAGKEHANSVNLTYIESRATYDAQLNGYEDGLKNKIKDSSFYGLSSVICDTPVVFKSTPTDYYRRTFQSYYETACDSVFGSKYAAVYSESYNSGKQVYEAEQTKLDEEKKASDSRNTLTGWIIGISVVGAIIYFSRNA